MQAHQPHGPLCVLEGRRRLRSDLTLTFLIPIGAGIGHAVFQEHTRNARRGQPVANSRAFQVDRQNLIPAARKDDDGSASVFLLRRVQGDCRARYVAHINPRFTRNQGLGLRGNRLGLRGTGRTRHRTRPDRHLHMSRSGLPVGSLRFQRRTGKDGTDKNCQRPEHSPRTSSQTI